nr:MAG TPA: hypothetical protein [Caudoviricetes sp.]
MKNIAITNNSSLTNSTSASPTIPHLTFHIPHCAKSITTLNI